MKLTRVSSKKVVIESDKPIYTMDGDGIAIIASEQPVKSFNVVWKTKKGGM